MSGENGMKFLMLHVHMLPSKHFIKCLLFTADTIVNFVMHYIDIMLSIVNYCFHFIHKHVHVKNKLLLAIQIFFPK